MKTYTPELSPRVLGQLAEYAASFADAFPQARPAQWAGVYLQGLLLDGERNSIEPLSRRVYLPEGLAVKDKDQALQQFVNQSPWDEAKVLARYRSLLAQTFASLEGLFLFDDVSFPKQGNCSVGVQRQYCGALGKKANCQVAVSVHYVSPKGHYPLDLRLYLPEGWLNDKKRLDKAGVPQAKRRELSKPQIALELLDRVRAEGSPRPIALSDLAKQTRLRRVTWREGTKQAVGAVRLVARLAGLGLAERRLRGQGPGVAADRGAG